jgi:hypothetical protein
MTMNRNTLTLYRQIYYYEQVYIDFKVEILYHIL